MVKCLTSRAERICTEDSLPDELQSIRHTLRQNWYPEKFTSKNMKQKPHTTPLTTVPKKSIYLRLHFKGVILSEIVSQKLKKLWIKLFQYLS